jgi:hypothetical protein
MLNRKGQSTLEYAIVVAIIVGGLLAMQFYVKRGWEGKLRSAADDMGEQFEPAKYSGTLTLNSSSNVTQNIIAKGATTVTHNQNAVNSKTGTDGVATWTTGAGADLYEGQ